MTWRNLLQILAYRISGGIFYKSWPIEFLGWNCWLWLFVPCPVILCLHISTAMVYNLRGIHELGWLDFKSFWRIFWAQPWAFIWEKCNSNLLEKLNNPTFSGLAFEFLFFLSFLFLYILVFTFWKRLLNLNLIINIGHFCFSQFKPYILV